MLTLGLFCLSFIKRKGPNCETNRRNAHGAMDWDAKYWCWADVSEAPVIKTGAQNFLQIWAKISLKFERRWLTPSQCNPAHPGLDQDEGGNALGNAPSRRANTATLFL